MDRPPVPPLSILAVDDDPAAIELVRIAAPGALVEGAASMAAASALLRARRFDLVFLDLGLEDASGPEILDRIVPAAGEAPVAIMTGDDRSATIVECMRRGAFDYLTKPLSALRIRTIIGHAEERAELRRFSAGAGKRQAAFSRIITRSPLMLALFDNLERVAPSPYAVLVNGESGTGKELVARAIHELSGRAGPFVPINVAGLDDSLFADTLFGHVRGAYTGADAGRRGLIREAEGGTLFLDEIGDLGPETQVKLLRFLQDGEYYPLGADRPERSTARPVLATNVELLDRVRAGSFRADLYYRLAIHRIIIPPLRDRREDIPLLVEHFAREAADSLGRPRTLRLEPFMEALDKYSFPGNIRELFALVQGAVAVSSGELLAPDYALEHLRRHREERPPAPAACPEPAGLHEDEGGRFLRLEELEDRHIAEALKRSKGRQTEAAALLGVSQSTISRWMASHDMQNE